MFDSVDLEYRMRCVHCGHSWLERVGWLLEHAEFACPQGCGAHIVSPVAELSALIPVGNASAHVLDLSTWEPKKMRRAAARRAARQRRVQGKTQR